MVIQRSNDGLVKFDIYYTGLPEFHTWAAHIVRQIKHALKILPEKRWRCAIMTRDNFLPEDMNAFLQPVFGDRLRSGIFLATKYLVADNYPLSALSKL